jgi:hypothetical protein
MVGDRAYPLSGTDRRKARPNRIAIFGFCPGMKHIEGGDQRLPLACGILRI